jgi:putative addiction module killer protein
VALTRLAIDVGPGYRTYFTLRGNAIVILLCGGDKKTRQRDIKHAAQLAKEV